MTLEQQVKLIPLDGHGLSGYAISHRGEMGGATCAIAFDESGRLHVFEHSSGLVSPVEILEGLQTSGTTARSDVSWAFTMLGSDDLESLATALSLPHEGREAYVAHLQSLLSEGIGLVNDQVDHDACSALSSSPRKRLSSYEFYRGNSERSIMRRQAAAAYPVLADHLASSLPVKMAIDRAKPLADVLPTLIRTICEADASRPLIKRLAQAQSLPEHAELSHVIKLMAHVPADWIPTKGEEWSAFCTVAEGFFGRTEMDADMIASCLKGCGGKWVEFRDRIIRKAGVEQTNPTTDYLGVMDNIRDMVQMFTQLCTLPLAAYSSKSSEVVMTPELAKKGLKSARRMLFAGRSMSDIADLQRRWHQERASILAAPIELAEANGKKLIQGLGEGEWPSMTDPVQAPNGLWIVPLNTPHLLFSEGDPDLDENGVPGLEHCVGGYASSARSGNCHIYSVRNIHPDGRYERLSTVEFGAVSPDMGNLKIMQHRGKKNATPPASARDVVNWFAANVSNRRIQINWEQMRAFQESGTIPEDGVERLCGYRWSDREILNAAVMPWGPYVASPYRRMGLDDVMESQEIASIRDAIPPEIILLGAR